MKKILLLLAQGFETYEASVFIDVFGWNLVDGAGNTQLFTAGQTQQVRTSFDQRVIVDYLLEEVDPANFDALAIPGGFEQYGFYESAYSQSFQDLIKAFHRQGKPIASICVAALAVAKTGLLTGKRATTYQLNPARQAALAEMGAIIVQQPIVEDAGIITSWNPATAIDVALLLLERVTNEETAALIRQLIGF